MPHCAGYAASREDEDSRRERRTAEVDEYVHPHSWGNGRATRLGTLTRVQRVRPALPFETTGVGPGLLTRGDPHGIEAV